MTDLILRLKREYFEAIASGEKTEEYRLVNDHWGKQIADKEWTGIVLTLGYPKWEDVDKIIRRPWRGYEIKKIEHKHFGDMPVFVYAIAVNREDGLR